MSRIEIHDSTIDAFRKLAEGNPRAISVCAQLFKETSKTDPNAALGGLASLLSLDSNEIYGPRIWMLYKDVCEENITKTIAVLRGRQLGFITSVQLHHAIDNRGDNLNVNEILDLVMERLPEFNQERDKND